MTSAKEKRATQPAEAGHWGENVRSDLHVRVEPRASGGLEIALESRVKPYYGNAILTQTRQVLETLAVKHAMISVHRWLEREQSRARIVMGTNTFGLAPNVVPLKPSPVTPMIVIVWPLTIIVLSRTAGLAPRRVCQYS